MQNEKNGNGKIVLQITFALLLLLFCVVIFVLFTQDNRERVIQQNENYVKETTLQVGYRIDAVMTGARENIKTLAYLCGKMLETPEVSETLLKELADNSAFDYLEYTDLEGMNLTDTGESADISDRENYILGIQGNSGMCVADNFRNTGKEMVIYYAPVYFQNEIIGVLNGIYGNEVIQEITSATFFRTQARSYLCMDDGTVIASYGDDQAPVNILDALPGSLKIDEEDLKLIRKTFQNHGEYGYRYTASQGTGSAYLMGLPQENLMLLIHFPSKVSNQMIEAVNASGIRMGIVLVAAFGLYIVFIIVLDQKQKRLLVTENREIYQIVEGVTRLYSRFVVVDLGNNTYEYLEELDSGLHKKGDYSDLIESLTARYIREDGTEDMSQVITADYIRKHLSRNIPYLQYEYPILWENGDSRWEHMSILSLKEENGVPVIVLFAIQDVTRLKQEEQQSREALRQAFRAADEANHAKSDFLSRMSHDIRTPMNAIMGMTAVAAMHLDDRERLSDCLNKISLSSRHLLALINDVLDMSKIESGKLTIIEEEINLSEMTDSLLAIIYPQMHEKHQELKVNLSGIIHEDVISDALRLQQVFVNIMNNAVKFTPEGGTITFCIREKPCNVQGCGCYEFVFEDNGIGMSPEFLKVIFEPFEREKKLSTAKTEGTGLGMAITRSIVRMMNGDIQVESRLGEGAKFTVQVYLKLQNVRESTEEVLKDLRVLVADDEPEVGEEACRMLNSIGMHSDWVQSGDEAVAKLSEAVQNPYSVVILDWKMPGKCGVETAKEIRDKIGDEIPIIILSAYDWSAIENEARKAGVNAFISKPLFKSRLVYTLKTLMENKQPEYTAEEALEAERYKGKKALLVDDNEINLEVAKELLCMTGIEVEEAHDGQEAVDMLLEKPAYTYDIVFMDIQMPKKNGYEAVREIRTSGREDLRQIPIAAMSADAFSDDIEKSLSVGMNGHIAKPVEFSKLLAVLDQWLGRELHE